MLREKYKFYEPTHTQQTSENINDIYKLMNKQEQNIDDLLQRYRSSDKEDNFGESRTIDVVLYTGKQISNKKKRASSIKGHPPLELPLINSAKMYNKEIGKNLPPFITALTKRDKKALSEIEKPKDRNDHVQKVYVLKKNKSKKRVKSIEKQDKNITSNERYRQQLFSQLKQQNNSQKIDNLPTPLGYFKETGEEDDSSSQEGDVPLAYYEKEFRTLLRAQCLQETNFLYFSKNEAMKDWTDSLLMLFQKHDKQLQSLRKKCKYLQKFDNNFFTIDIFKD